MIRCRRILAGDPWRWRPHRPCWRGAGPGDGALFHLGDGIGYLGCRSTWAGCGAGRQTQPDHLRSPLLPAGDIGSPGCSPPSGSWSCSPRIPAGCTVSSGRWWETAFTRDWAAPYGVELGAAWVAAKGNRLAQWAASEGSRHGGTWWPLATTTTTSACSSRWAGGGHGQCGAPDQTHADQVTADHNEDGIALALQRWVLPA